jgi:hypothetical protein
MELCRVQIFLDRAGFRPGKIDGLGGEFTQKAADRYCNAKGLPRGTVLDISSVPSPYREHVVSEEDAKWVGSVASQPSEQAKLKSLKYGSFWEAVAERFHCDQKFLVELNPQITEPSVGSVLRVPDVKEFLLADVKRWKGTRKQKQTTTSISLTTAASPSHSIARDLRFLETDPAFLSHRADTKADSHTNTSANAETRTQAQFGASTERAPHRGL